MTSTIDIARNPSKDGMRFMFYRVCQFSVFANISRIQQLDHPRSFTLRLRKLCFAIPSTVP